MVIIVLFGAIAFYGALYFLYANAQGRLNSVGSVLATFERMLLVPETDIFKLLRLAILVVAVYVVYDLIISAAKRANKKRRDKQEEPQVLRFKDPTR